MGKCPKLDELIENQVKFPVLDDGFIQVVDYMGDDSAVVQAARVSYGAGTKTVREDRGLIRYLMRHSHTSPFEMCELKVLIRIPMDAWRQYIRHRTASVNEYSTRYSIAIDSQQATEPDAWRLQAKNNKQGSGSYASVDSVGYRLSEREKELHDFARDVYEERITYGIAREQARKDLPLSTYTEAYWKIDLHNLLHFLRLRMHPHAQQEIREYANVLADIVKRWCPYTYEAFCDYRLNAHTFSSEEMALLKFLVASAEGVCVETEGLSKREVKEFKEKLGLK